MTIRKARCDRDRPMLGTSYIQHNPLVPNGYEHLAEVVKIVGPSFNYEPGMIWQPIFTIPAK